MQIYLPIAEISVHIFLLMSMGGVVGFLSGMFGVGGGFLITPLLIFLGIPVEVAVATGSNQVVASSVSGVLGHFKRKAVDIKLGFILLIGGVMGALGGVYLVDFLKSVGQLDLIVSLLYVLFLGTVGLLMLVESLRTQLKSRRSGGASSLRQAGQHTALHRLPFKMQFPRSRLYSSIIPIIMLGGIIGLLSAIMGVGGGFIMIPAMIYILKIPTNVVVGTSLFQILVVMSVTTILHAVENQSVDIVLALILMVGGVIGAQLGVQVGHRLKAEQLRALLALLVLMVCGRLFLTLILEPTHFYSMISMGGVL